ncbi:MAG: hypothetical protein A4E52_01576 [Pelotomaculum sp. PtaB.Bin013]|nr:MAG: hypothetical protein A4E52_01576 [Pelotomaculum sp. PtaB.Bin013]
MEMDTKTYGEIMGALGSIRSDIKSLGEKLDTLGGQLSKAEERICALEQRPARRWDTVVVALISAAIGAGVGALIK